MAQPALFSNQRQTNVRSSVALIERVLAQLGHKDCAQPNPAVGELTTWRLRHGSAAIEISLLDRQPMPHVRVSAVVMTLDAKVDRPMLFAHLLETNFELVGAAFALVGDRIVLIAERPTLDLDYSEMTDILNRVLHTADHFDDQLVEEFGGTLGEKA
ncbi:MAG: YbjN domain-containing protein [Kofleriaceae bacterium]|nr:YbjN domain-containing protein [Kofleriaceae bacterium]